jgi:hypothetical protein
MKSLGGAYSEVKILSLGCLSVVAEGMLGVLSQGDNRTNHFSNMCLSVRLI